MLHSNDFQQTTIKIKDNEFEMEYDLKQPKDNSLVCFGNIYVNNDEPIEFSFFTLNDKIAGYTPLNGTKDFISNIVTTILEVDLPFE